MEVSTWIIFKIKNKMSFLKESPCFIVLYYRIIFILEKIIKTKVYLNYAYISLELLII